ncbi:MAG TPA: hypothetical protein PKZ24_11925, partial [Nitrospirales bacterium]|nr:hypothetical protein [Nitrospirales bacterium]
MSIHPLTIRFINIPNPPMSIFKSEKSYLGNFSDLLTIAGILLILRVRPPLVSVKGAIAMVVGMLPAVAGFLAVPSGQVGTPRGHSMVPELVERYALEPASVRF